MMPLISQNQPMMRTKQHGGRHGPGEEKTADDQGCDSLDESRPPWVDELFRPQGLRQCQPLVPPGLGPLRAVKRPLQARSLAGRFY